MLEKALEANTKAQAKKRFIVYPLAKKKSLHIWPRTNAKETKHGHENDTKTMELIEKSMACSRGFYFLIFSLTYSVKQQRQNGQELTNVASKFHPLSSLDCAVENSILNQLEQYQRNV